jgi:cyanate permease
LEEKKGVNKLVNVIIITGVIFAIGVQIYYLSTKNYSQYYIIKNIMTIVGLVGFLFAYISKYITWIISFGCCVVSLIFFIYDLYKIVSNHHKYSEIIFAIVFLFALIYVVGMTFKYILSTLKRK